MANRGLHETGQIRILLEKLWNLRDPIPDEQIEVYEMRLARYPTDLVLEGIREHRSNTETRSLPLPRELHATIDSLASARGTFAEAGKARPECPWCLNTRLIVGVCYVADAVHLDGMSHAHRQGLAKPTRSEDRPRWVVPPDVGREIVADRRTVRLACEHCCESSLPREAYDVTTREWATRYGREWIALRPANVRRYERTLSPHEPKIEEPQGDALRALIAEAKEATKNVAKSIPEPEEETEAASC